jgi:hypothetical protein
LLPKAGEDDAGEKTLMEEREITIDQIRALLAEHGFETEITEEGALKVREVESGLLMTSVLEEDVLFNTVACLSVAKDRITPELLWRMLESDNGITTSGFQLYDRDDGRVTITLNNFCKLQNLGEEDADDILSCLNFLVVDVFAARELLADLGE